MDQIPENRYTQSNYIAIYVFISILFLIGFFFTIYRLYKIASTKIAQERWTNDGKWTKPRNGQGRTGGAWTCWAWLRTLGESTRTTSGSGKLSFTYYFFRLHTLFTFLSMYFYFYFRSRRHFYYYFFTDAATGEKPRILAGTDRILVTCFSQTWEITGTQVVYNNKKKNSIILVC